jgi:hypothetical protein
MTEIRVEHYRGYRIVAYEQEREFLIAVYASTNFVLKAISVPKSAGIAGAFAAAREFINKEWEKGSKRNRKPPASSTVVPLPLRPPSRVLIALR